MKEYFQNQFDVKLNNKYTFNCNIGVYLRLEYNAFFYHEISNISKYFKTIPFDGHESISLNIIETFNCRYSFGILEFNRTVRYEQQSGISSAGQRREIRLLTRTDFTNNPPFHPRNSKLWSPSRNIELSSNGSCRERRMGEEDTASARKRASRVQIRLWTSGIAQLLWPYRQTPLSTSLCTGISWRRTIINYYPYVPARKIHPILQRTLVRDPVKPLIIAI